MNDYADHIRDAVAAAAARTVAPPFAGVEHRARARHLRRTGALVTVVVLALVGTAVALPRDGRDTVPPVAGPGTLKPATQYRNDPAAVAAVRACLAALETPVPNRPHLMQLPDGAVERCYHEAGYETPVPAQQPPDPEACVRAPAGDLVAEGTAGTHRWAVHAGTGNGGVACVTYTLDGTVRGRLNEGTDASPNGGSEIDLLYSLPAPYDRWNILYGTLPAGVTRAVWTVDGKTYEVPARTLPASAARPFYAFVARTTGTSMTFSYVAYDAGGTEVSRTAPQTLVLSE
jgi:hypothetical protein